MQTSEGGETHDTRHGDTRARCMRAGNNEGETQVTRAGAKTEIGELTDTWARDGTHGEEGETQADTETTRASA